MVDVDFWKTILYLCWWSIPGTLIRIYFDVLFEVDKASTLRITTSNGAAFQDLPANALGCFIIGLVASAAQMKLSQDGVGKDKRGQQLLPQSLEVVSFPYTSSFQKSKHLLLGIRTGLCGSITTFSAWVLQCVQMICAGQVVGAAFVYVIGFEISLFSMWAGMAVAQQIHRHRQLTATQVSEASQNLLYAADNPLSVEVSIDSVANGGTPSPASTPAPAPAPVALDPPIVDTNKIFTGTDWFFLVTFILFEVGAILGTVYNSTNYQSAQRYYWVALMMAPVGVLLRWKLGALLNGGIAMMPASWKWFPLGTLTANVLACFIDGIAQGVLFYKWQDDSHYTGLKALVLGFSGSLSTVSTFMMEVFKFMPAVYGKDSYFRPFAYALISLSLGTVACISTYVWSTV